MIYNWSEYTVLIAEDDPINFRYLELLLSKRTGIQIMWAKNGSEAYEKIINHSVIDIVLLDLQLPELNGLDVLRQAKAILPQLPIIMQTANSWNEEEQNCLMAGCDGFFPKPLDIDMLFKHMDCCIQRYNNIKTINLADSEVMIDA